MLSFVANKGWMMGGIKDKRLSASTTRQQGEIWSVSQYHSLLFQGEFKSKAFIPPVSNLWTSDRETDLFRVFSFVQLLLLGTNCSVTVQRYTKHINCDRECIWRRLIRIVIWSSGRYACDE